jgi:hypothetical protein
MLGRGWPLLADEPAGLGLLRAPFSRQQRHPPNQARMIERS